MATLKIKRKLAAMARETDEYPKNNRSQNSPAPGITEECIAQVSEEVEGKVTEKLSQEVSRTESCILRALSKLDEFRNADLENQEPSRDRSQNDYHPEVEFSACRASKLTDSDPDETSHMARGDEEKVLLLLWDFFRQTKEGTLHKSAAISQ